MNKKTEYAGYDPNNYKKLYNSYSGSPQDKINAMRRDLYAENADEIRAQKRAAYALRKEND